MNDLIEAWREQVRSAAAAGGCIAIRGGDTKAFYGRPTAGEPLDTRAFRGIVNYEPSELVVTVRAGTPLAELEAALKGRGELTIDTVNFPELQTGSWPLGMAVKVEEQALADAIAAALAELKRDGSLTEIFRRHGISHTPA